MAGDFNAKVGEDTRSAGVGGSMDWERQMEMEKLINFCQENNVETHCFNITREDVTPGFPKMEKPEIRSTISW